MPPNLPANTYQSPPGSGGNDGAIPTVYDPTWQRYNNLTPAQILAFQAFPQDLNGYIALRRWQWEICSNIPNGPPTTFITLPTSVSNPNISGMQLTTDFNSQNKIAQVKQAFDNGTLVVGTFPFIALNGPRMITASDITAIYGFVVRWVQQTYVVAATLLNGVGARTVTTRAQIDAAFASMQVI